MFVVRQTIHFADWLADLRDRRARAKILARLNLCQGGNFRDHKSVGGGLSEMRIHYGPGFRLYFTIRRQTIVILPVGGDKGTQAGDINKARKLLESLEEP